MDGVELCSKVKQQLLTSHIPVVLLTAKTDVQYKIKGIETGADAYIEKPFNTEYLMAVVNNILAQREKLRSKYSEEPDFRIESASMNKIDKRFIKSTRQIIEQNISNPEFSVEKLSKELGLSRSQLFRKFGALFNLKPNELIRVERLKFARNLLQQKDNNVNEVAIMTGFSSTSYFISSFKKYFGDTPAQFMHK
jgi:AraC-like DNA-binding protein